ncbi:MAG: hypothetical protein AAGI53_03585 [Planctomycetota bacterium]
MKNVILAVVAGLVGGATGATTLVSESDQGSVNAKTITAFDFASHSIGDIYDLKNAQFGGNDGINKVGTGIDQSDLMGDKVNVFFADTTEGLAFFFVFDNGIAGDDSNVASTSSNVSANGATGDVIFSPAGNQYIATQDDVGDSIQATNGTDPFSFDLRWAKGFTDGIAGSFGPPNVNGFRDITLALEDVLNLAGLDSVNGFNLISADGSTYTGTFDDLGGASELGGYANWLSLTVIPLPHPAAMAGFALFGLGMGARRR